MSPFLLSASNCFGKGKDKRRWLGDLHQDYFHGRKSCGDSHLWTGNDPPGTTRPRVETTDDNMEAEIEMDADGNGETTPWANPNLMLTEE